MFAVNGIPEPGNREKWVKLEILIYSAGDKTLKETNRTCTIHLEEQAAFGAEKFAFHIYSRYVSRNPLISQLIKMQVNNTMTNSSKKNNNSNKTSTNLAS